MANQSSSFQALKQAWQAKWSTMAPRERQIAVAAAWLAGLTLVIMVGVRPAWRTLSDAPTQLRDLDSQLDQMRRLADETQALKLRPPVPPAQSEAALKSATDRLGGGARLAIQGDRATLTLNKVSGDALASWLDEARGAARAKPTEAGLMQVEPGVYSGNIVLALGPGAGGGR
jgi:general secretion pathway protein M